MSQPNPFAPPQSEVDDVPAPDHAADIASLDVSDGWKAKFHLIEQAGGVKLPRLKTLSTGERLKASFNILGFFFGPFYYLSKGMWKKGLSLFLVCVAVIIALTVALELAGLGRFVKSLGYGAGAVFAIRANIDYYKKKVLGQNGWW